MIMVTDHHRPGEVPMVAAPKTRGLIATPGRLVSALCWAGGLLLIISALIHLHLWAGGYRHIPTIGPLFLLQGAAGIALALVVTVSRQPLAVVAGALFALGTLGGLVLSIEVGLFGFKDSLSAPYATLSVVVESAAFVALGLAWLTASRRGTSTG
jgi:hypothetical protein